jgi:hypothetical protein
MEWEQIAGDIDLGNSDELWVMVLETKRLRMKDNEAMEVPRSRRGRDINEPSWVGRGASTTSKLVLEDVVIEPGVVRRVAALPD